MGIFGGRRCASWRCSLLPLTRHSRAFGSLRDTLSRRERGPEAAPSLRRLEGGGGQALGGFVEQEDGALEGGDGFNLIVVSGGGPGAVHRPLGGGVDVHETGVAGHAEGGDESRAGVD